MLVNIQQKLICDACQLDVLISSITKLEKTENRFKLLYAEDLTLFTMAFWDLCYHEGEGRGGGGGGGGGA